MGFTAFVFGSMRQSVSSRGVVAQMKPAPAATCQTHERFTHAVLFRTGSPTETGWADLIALRRTTWGANQSATQTTFSSTTTETGAFATEWMVCVAPVVTFSRVRLPAGKAVIQRSPEFSDQASAPGALSAQRPREAQRRASAGPTTRIVRTTAPVRGLTWVTWGTYEDESCVGWSASHREPLPYAMPR